MKLWDLHQTVRKVALINGVITLLVPSEDRIRWALAGGSNGNARWFPFGGQDPTASGIGLHFADPSGRAIWCEGPLAAQGVRAVNNAGAEFTLVEYFRRSRGGVMGLELWELRSAVRKVRLETTPTNFLLPCEGRVRWAITGGSASTARWFPGGAQDPVVSGSGLHFQDGSGSAIWVDGPLAAEGARGIASAGAEFTLVEYFER